MGATSAAWLGWIANLGHDTYSYPWWVTEQQLGCKCKVDIAKSPRSVACMEDGTPVSWRSAVSSGSSSLTYCLCKQWLLEHMPEFDLHFLPNAMTVNGTSMLDDVIAFTLMADKAAAYSPTIPLGMKLAYILPYAAYHESRQNWRPLLFAKFFGLVANATSVEAAMARLLAPNVFLEWTSHYWPSSPRQAGEAGTYQIKWSSSTAPPVVAPLDFVAYGYGSCSAWATFVTYVMRSVGLPARQAGTPCWNGGNFGGLASRNPNVSVCWHGGSSALGHGGQYLYNHNWAEVFVPPSALPNDASPAPLAGASRSGWTFVNVPPQSKLPDEGLCGSDFDASHGCGFDPTAAKGAECEKASGPGAAMQDHEIFAVTWSQPDDEEALERTSDPTVEEGGPVLSVAGRVLTDGHTPLTPLVWASQLTSPLGEPLRDVGLRVVNRTDFYRCKPKIA